MYSEDAVFYYTFQSCQIWDKLFTNCVPTWMLDLPILQRKLKLYLLDITFVLLFFRNTVNPARLSSSLVNLKVETFQQTTLFFFAFAVACFLERKIWERRRKKEHGHISGVSRFPFLLLNCDKALGIINVYFSSFPDWISSFVTENWRDKSVTKLHFRFLTPKNTFFVPQYEMRGGRDSSVFAPPFLPLSRVSAKFQWQKPPPPPSVFVLLERVKNSRKWGYSGR
jgi:hypothetical protein